MMKKRTLTAEDLKRFRFISDPQLSPDGKSLLFVVTHSIEEGRNGDYESNIWRFSRRIIAVRSSKESNCLWL